MSSISRRRLLGFAVTGGAALTGGTLLSQLRPGIAEAKKEMEAPFLRLSFAVVPDLAGYQGLSSITGDPACDFSEPQPGPFCEPRMMKPLASVNPDGSLVEGAATIGEIRCWGWVMDPTSTAAWYSIDAVMCSEAGAAAAGSLGPGAEKRQIEEIRVTAQGRAVINAAMAGLGAGEPAGLLVVTGGWVRMASGRLPLFPVVGGWWSYSAWAAGSTTLKADVAIVLSHDGTTTPKM
ncbi:MAG: hypothetical protein QN152_13270 [Armatimonadota bacterium]|nr:hypothetical protein [Armatimonadota bacterium]